MNIDENLKKLLESICSEDIDIIDKLKYIIAFIRPKSKDDIDLSVNSINKIIDFFNSQDELAQNISNSINQIFIESKISTNIVHFGILSNNYFSYEARERFYNKFLPNPPKKGDLNYIFGTIFNKKDDFKWVCSIENSIWVEFFKALFNNSKNITKTKNHLFNELLDALEILSIWIAAEEFDSNFIRLDKKLLNKDSAFIALQRNIALYIENIQSDFVNIEITKSKLEELDVLIQQSYEQVSALKRKSLHNGISIDLTYQLERLTQMIKRVEYILELIKYFDTKDSNEIFVNFFKESVVQNSKKNSLIDLYKQGIKIVARSVTNYTSEHGEHYIATDLKAYFKMFLSAAGAGIIIAIMALIKINITQAGFSIGTQTFLSSLNYGLGFVFIHILGFTVATKQPAMTASKLAQEIEQDENNKANQKKIIDLIFQVSRSQFSAIAGNVILAISVAFLISYLAIKNGYIILDDEDIKYYLKNLEPNIALFYAAIAGVWLFLSGLISGYFDNRADLLELKDRYYHQPLLKKLISDKYREKFATYLHEHYGSILGNFFFGILLGITPFIGYLLNLPLDISHVAFSSAYLGYTSMHFDISVTLFIYYLVCVLLIGFVNLIVSFTLALKVSLLSRDTKFGNFFSFIKNLIIEICKKPHKLFFPFTYKNKK